MKKMKKFFALLIAVAMVLSMGMTAFAAATEDSGKGGEASITITLPTDTNTENTYSYTIYKVFDAEYSTSGISYSLVEGKTEVPTSFILDDGGNVLLGTTSESETGATGEVQIKVNGNTLYFTPQTTELTTAQISAIAAYVGESDKIGTYTAAVSDGTLTVTGLEYGYYYITTTTGTVVTVDSTNPDAAVIDKNTVPELDKTITGVSDGSLDEAGEKAIAEVGSTVNYEVEITVGKGVENYVMHDVMSDGLTYNNDAKVYVRTTAEDGTVTDTEVTESETTWSDDTTAEGDTLTVTFVNDYTKSLAEGTVLVVKYSATVNNDAIIVDAENNTASLDYKNGDGVNSTPTSSTKVYNATFTVTKTDESGEALAGAGFIISKTETVDETTTTYYYKLDGEDVSWVTDKDEATELTTAVETTYYTDNTYTTVSDEETDYSKKSAVITFTGLADGTYTLIENTTPTGYNTAADQTFTIKGETYTADNLAQSTTVVNNKGVELPSTGGIGTTIFYVIGAILVIGAGVVLVTRRRMDV